MQIDKNVNQMALPYKFPGKNAIQNTFYDINWRIGELLDKYSPKEFRAFIVDLDRLDDLPTKDALYLRYIAFCFDKDKEISTRALERLFDRIAGRPTQRVEGTLTTQTGSNVTELVNLDDDKLASIMGTIEGIMSSRAKDITPDKENPATESEDQSPGDGGGIAAIDAVIDDRE